MFIKSWSNARFYSSSPSAAVSVMMNMTQNVMEMVPITYVSTGGVLTLGGSVKIA